MEPYLHDPSILKIGHDLKAFMTSNNLMIGPVDDVMVMSYVLDGAKHKHTLPDLATTHLGEDLPQPDASDHACACADYILRLHTKLRESVFLNHMVTLYETVERPLIPVLTAMEQRGVKVDDPLLRHMSDDFAKGIDEAEQAACACAGHEFNLGSPKQLGEVLFEEMQLKGGKKSKKTGSYSTDASVLEDLAAQGHEIAKHILQYRGLSKLKSTYTDALPKEIRKSTGRVHTTFAMTATTTGRLSSLHPNLQNIPIRTEEGKKIRTAFIAEQGNSLISADYSQIELRLLAHIADIKVLQEAFTEGQDIHAKTASQVFGVKLNEVDSNQRRAAKAINFGIIYGQSAYGLAASLGIPREEAKHYIEAYFKEYPGIRDYMEDKKSYAHEHGHVTTLYGRKIYLPTINGKGSQRAFAERAAINAPLQGSAADIIKKAMITLHRYLQKHYPDTSLILQVHDELLLEGPTGDADAVAKQVKSTMEQVISLTVPIIAETTIGNNWGEIH